MHWNGRSWSQVTRPAPVAGSLNAVTATATRGWAVGDVHPGGAVFSPLILRLTGKAWPRPATSYGTHMGDDVRLTGVAITSASTAWAIGNTQATAALACWSGRTWTSAYALFPLPAVYLFNGIAARQGRTAFRVDSRLTLTSGVPFSAMLTGAAWHKRRPVPRSIRSVSPRAGSAWAAATAGTRSLLLRWTGKTWTKISATAHSTLDALGFTATRDGWAVGTSGPDTLILRWNGSS
jgi:hypothetical protein